MVQSISLYFQILIWPTNRDRNEKYGVRIYTDPMGSRLHNHVVTVTLTLTLTLTLTHNPNPNPNPNPNTKT